MGKSRTAPRNRRQKYGKRLRYRSAAQRAASLVIRSRSGLRPTVPARPHNRAQALPVLLHELELHLREVFSYLGKRGVVKGAKRHEAGIFLVPNRELRAMKKKFFGKAPKTVDVLAFPEPRRFPHPETRKIPLGEIYLNRGIVRRSPERGRHLLRHGLLHLLGYRHRRKSDIIRMQGLERELEEFLSRPSK